MAGRLVSAPPLSLQHACNWGPHLGPEGEEERGGRCRRKLPLPLPLGAFARPPPCPAPSGRMILE